MIRTLNTLFALAASALLATAAPPFVGEKAPDFSLATPAGNNVQLSQMVAKGPVVLVVLRGYPGYQCPYCNRQVQDFISSAQAFSDAGAQVLMVYPGPRQDLGSKANDFLVGKQLPANFNLVLDPGYQVTNQYGLRWDAPKETAYPSTFLLDRNGIVYFMKIAKEHGGRTTAAEILDAVPKRKSDS